MDQDWIARWRDGRIAFHEGHANTFLDRYIARFAGCRRVLVPLCGKAEDESGGDEPVERRCLLVGISGLSGRPQKR